MWPHIYFLYQQQSFSMHAYYDICMCLCGTCTCTYMYVVFMVFMISVWYIITYMYFFFSRRKKNLLIASFLVLPRPASTTCTGSSLPYAIAARVVLLTCIPWTVPCTSAAQHHPKRHCPFADQLHSKIVQTWTDLSKMDTIKRLKHRTIDTAIGRRLRNNSHWPAEAQTCSR